MTLCWRDKNVPKISHNRCLNKRCRLVGIISWVRDMGTVVHWKEKYQNSQPFISAAAQRCWAMLSLKEQPQTGGLKLTWDQNGKNLQSLWKGAKLKDISSMSFPPANSPFPVSSVPELTLLTATRWSRFRFPFSNALSVLEESTDIIHH